MRRICLGIAALACLSLLLAGVVVRAEDSPALPESKPSCKIDCINSHADDEQGRQVIDVLEGMLKCLERQDFKAVADTLDDDASMYDEKSQDLVTGKDKIIERLKQRLSPTEEEKLERYEIRDAYARVIKDTCTVTYMAMKDYGGTHPYKMQSHCSIVFERKDGKWKLILFRSAFHKVH